MPKVIRKAPGVNGQPIPGRKIQARVIVPPSRIDRFTAAELMALDLPEPACILDGIVTTGLNLLVSRPKIGKSWLALDLSIAIASGGMALGFEVEQGDVLNLALEDSRRRLQKRLAKILDGDAAPERLTLATRWPRNDDGGLDEIEKWIKSVADPRLVIIDTLARLKGACSVNSNQYAQDYADIGEIKALADAHGIGILAIHHVRKMAGDDFMDTVSGTTGITAAADTIIVLKRERGQHDACLHVTGRDVEEQELAMKWDAATCRWSILGNADKYRADAGETKRVIDFLAKHGKPMRPSELAPLLGKEPVATRLLLWRASKDGTIKSDGRGSYSVMPTGA